MRPYCKIELMNCRSSLDERMVSRASRWAYWGRVNPIGIRSCYDEGKRAAECLMMDYRRQNAVNTKIARIFNTYGPRMAVNEDASSATSSFRP